MSKFKIIFSVRTLFILINIINIAGIISKRFKMSISEKKSLFSLFRLGFLLLLFFLAYKELIKLTVKDVIQCKQIYSTQKYHIKKTQMELCLIYLIVERTKKFYLSRKPFNKEQKL